MRQISDMIAFLIVAHQVQGGRGIENGFGQNAGEQEPHLVKGQSRRFVLEFHSQADQKMMDQRHEHQMVLPAQPTAGVIMVEAEFAFAFFKDNFDGPPQPAQPNQRQQGDIGRGVAEVELASMAAA